MRSTIEENNDTELTIIYDYIKTNSIIIKSEIAIANKYRYAILYLK